MVYSQKKTDTQNDYNTVPLTDSWITRLSDKESRREPRGLVIRRMCITTAAKMVFDNITGRVFIYKFVFNIIAAEL